MRATVVMTLHDISSLDAVRLADLTQALYVAFGVYPSVSEDTMVLRVVTDDHLAILRQVESTIVLIAIKYDPNVWVSTSSEEAT